ncbi:hypothetical protein EON81_13720 [bacterium]|nr:MAG: hypothetical protein EON81_13720 [bacterium]
MALRSGFTPSIVGPGGPVSSIDTYVLVSTANTAVRIEYYDGAGKTLGQYTLTVGPAPAGLRSLALTVSTAAAAVHEKADGAAIRVDGATEVRYNTSGEVTGPLAPSTNAPKSIGVWVPNEVAVIGWVGG